MYVLRVGKLKNSKSEQRGHGIASRKNEKDMTKQELRLAKWQDKSRALDGRGGGFGRYNSIDNFNESNGHKKRSREDISSGREAKEKPFKDKQHQHQQRQRQSGNSSSSILGFGGISASSATEKTHMRNKGTIIAGTLQGTQGKKIKFDDD